ncbi:SdpI family protein [Candidatus Woesearchaeota archaeon]|nr:SdpI family protein [Candidatus Woesearchaeota archaeon]
MKKTNIITILLILISFISAVYLYPRMPGQMASHWNAQGQVDGYMPKFWGLFLLPLIILGLFLLFLLIPKIDPLKGNIKKFRRYYDLFILFMVIFMLYIYFLIILWNFNVLFDMNRLLIPAMGLLFFYAGVLTENAKMNWFVGIRTPWTLSSEKVWNKTNRLGGKLFKIAALIAFLGFFFPDYSVLLIMIPVLSLVIFAVLYSFFEYKKEKK